MPFIEMPLESLQAYLPAGTENKDFDEFWEKTLTESRSFGLNPVFYPVDSLLKTIETYDVTFSGFNGQPIKGWLMLPKVRNGKLPCVVEFVGYGGGRGFPIDWLLWSSAGYAHFVMDTRGEGSTWLCGDTTDIEGPDSNPQFPGFMTRGILKPETYFYRRVFTDAVRAVEAAKSFPEIDSGRIAVTGGSQGGGISIAVSGLVPGIAVVMPDVPFLCHFRRALDMTNQMPYGEIIRFLSIHRDKINMVFNTLSYFDGMNLAARAKCRALFSVAMMDDTCPPSTVFAAYNRYAGPKDIKIYQYNNHEGGASYQNIEKMKFLKHLWG